MNKYDVCGNADNSETCVQKPGYAYVPVQKLGRVYTPEKAMARGTVFPELDISIGEYERGLYDGK